MPFSYGLVMYGASGSEDSAMQVVENQTFSSAATADFTTGIVSGAMAYELLFTLIPATDNVQLRLTMSEDAGSTWLAGTSYYGGSWYGGSAATSGQNNQAGAAFLSLCNAVDSLSGTGAAGRITVFNAPDSQYTHVTANCTYKLHDNTVAYVELKNGHIARSNAIDGFRLAFSSGNIATGEATLYKIATS